MENSLGYDALFFRSEAFEAGLRRGDEVGPPWRSSICMG